jgi:hypothetical protein
MWRWFLCRVVDYHHWVDTDGDGMRDACSVCRVGPFGPRRRGFSLADWLDL